MTIQELGEVLRHCRKSTSMNQSQLATYLHIDRTYVSKIELGQKEPLFTLVQSWLEITGHPKYLAVLLLDDEDVRGSIEAQERLQQIKEIVNSESLIKPIA